LDLATYETVDGSRLLILGRGLALVDNWPLARRLFQQAARANPTSPEAWAWLAEAQHQNGVDGKPALDRALALDPKSTLVRALRALYWKRQGKYRAELAEYQRAAQLEPYNAEWQAALGEAYTSTGDLVSALAAYQKAASLQSANPTYWRLLALFCADTGVQVADIGLPAAKKAVELVPADPQALDALGWAYARAGLLYNAQQSLTKAVELAPNLAIVHFHLAELYLLKGDQAAARRELTAASGLDPNGPIGASAVQILKQYFP
jgi:Flp pilus assembly protein TadD